MKTVWMVSGNKGGVGKSLFCLALASALESLDELYAVLDGDGRTGDVFSVFNRKCPARQADFRKLRPESHMCPYDLEYVEILHQLLRASNNLIINTPDGADNILLEWFDATLTHTESNNIQFKFIYLLSDRPDGLDMFNELAKRFNFLYPIRNLYFGTESLFTDFNRDYLEKFRVVIDLPVLRNQEVRILFYTKLYPAEAIRLENGLSKNFKLNTLTRARLALWQTSVSEIISDIFENNQSNLVYGKWHK